VATKSGADNNIYNISINPATQIAAGSLSAADKIKLDGLNSGANGIVETITATLPVQLGGTATAPVIGTRQASSTQSGHVARTALDTDVAAGTGGGSNTAVVTANLLLATNNRVETTFGASVHSIQAGTAITVNEADANNPVVSVTADSFIPFNLTNLGLLP